MHTIMQNIFCWFLGKIVEILNLKENIVVFLAKLYVLLLTGFEKQVLAEGIGIKYSSVRQLLPFSE